MVAVHVWQSTTAAIERPDFLLLDLDPAEDCTLAQLARAALRVREFLKELGIGDPLVKSSGARGLHVVTFIHPELDYKAVREIAHALGKELAQNEPGLFTIEREPRKRKRGTVYIDWGQVGRGMTIVPPFSVRACDGAPVSMPVAWDDVERWSCSRARTLPSFSIDSALEQLRSSGDPWDWKPAKLGARA